MSDYVLGIDQSTQGTKALLFDDAGHLIGRTDLPHRQIVDERGWVEHDLNEIYANTIQTVKNLVGKTGIDKNEIRVLGISNQRETAAAWNARTGEPVYNAIVWQCARGAAICDRIETEHPDVRYCVKDKTGLNFSPYFTAAKLAWIMENVPAAQEAAEKGELCMGTIDSFLVWQLTGGKVFRTDYSNASRTQLFNIRSLQWDEDLAALFGIPLSCLAGVSDSDGDYGTTDLDGYLDAPIPIRCVLGDSHGALFGQNCRRPGMIKSTFGTGSSIMMNIGETPVASESVVTSLAWKIGGKVHYVLEGNINFTGAVVSWMQDDLHLIEKASETSALARAAHPGDRTYLVPAFSGLGAPYWDNEARASFSGMSRTTGRAELVKAGLESIAYQVTDILNVMRQESGIPIPDLRVDGGPTGNEYLMQFLSDLAEVTVEVPDVEELSGLGVAYCAGIAAGIYDPDKVFDVITRSQYTPKMSEEERAERYEGWKNAVRRTLSRP